MFYSEPTTTIKQVPVGYFRTFTYQPLPFNAAAASPYFSYGASKMINPMQYWPSKAYTQLPASSLSSYNGPLQAQGSVNQQTREPSPLLTNSVLPPSSGSTSSGSPSSSSSASAPPAPTSYTNPQPNTPSSLPQPVASIAESLTSDAHLPSSPTSNTPVQPSPHTQPQQYTQSAPLAPIPAAQQYYQSGTGSATRSLVNPYLPAADYNQMTLPYMMAGAPLPMPPVQFVPCMCPVSYGMAAAPEVLAGKRGEDAMMAAEFRAQAQVAPIDSPMMGGLEETL